MLQLFQVPGTSDKPDQDFIIVMDQAHFVNKLEDVDIQTDVNMRASTIIFLLFPHEW